ncbi:hypothetical protein [Paracoccus sp. ME4]|uniref:hypothetical protein n=1 Tax=Paracoccus sp. ME4 TaxID=3138066 RepID=UPI00398A6B59
MTLPAVPGSQKERLPLHDRIPEPGSWWRVCPPEGIDAYDADLSERSNRTAEDLLSRDWAEGRALPEHGLVLLMTEAVIIDGELHSLVFAGHPGWQRDTVVKVRVDEFQVIMAEVPDGAELRAAEEADLMGYVRRITSDMASPPAQGEIAEIVARKRRETDRGAGPKALMAPTLPPDQASMVPAALLPSRDLGRAEEAVREQIILAEATREIMEGRVARVTAGMHLVSRYQQEKVSTALAGISRQRAFAERMLGSVHTMKLWLGEGVSLHAMTEGAGAPADAPVHFMQQMLYLDEEIWAANMGTEGFSSDHLGSLPELLQKNPEMRDRMLPYERCVCITRVRRFDRTFPVPANWTAIFAIIDKKEQDRLIQIFVRDGERVTMIVADEETSRAKRLFPSRAEIDGIFRDDRAGAGRSMDVHDVRYAERRADHDKVALAYRRVLLILWGAHEREQVFGSLPTGMNWLTEDTHAGHFRFIHDEEIGLASSREDIQSRLARHRAGVRAGSRVIGNWKDLFARRDEVPGAWTNTVHSEENRIRNPVIGHGAAFVQAKDRELHVQVEAYAPYSWKHEGKTWNLMVRISREASDPDGLADGVLCIDHLGSAEIRECIDSRRDRRHYRDWISNFSVALPLVTARERIEDALYNRIIADGHRPADEAILRLACHEAVLAAGWELPDRSADLRIIAFADAVRRSAGLVAEEDETLRILRNGDILRSREASPVLGGLFPERFDEQEILTLTGRNRLKLKSRRMGRSGLPGQVGELVLAAPTVPAGKKPDLPAYSLDLLTDREYLLSLLDGPAADEAGARLEGLLNPDASMAAEIVDELLAHNRASRSNTVLMPSRHVVSGFAVLPGRFDRGYWRTEEDRSPRLAMTVVRYDPLRHLWLSGHHDEVARFATIAADPSRLIGVIERSTGNTRNKTIELGLVCDWQDKGLRRTASQDELVFDIRGVGYGDLKLDRHKGEPNEAVWTPGSADLRLAIARAVIGLRKSETGNLADEQFDAWLRHHEEGTHLFARADLQTAMVQVLAMHERIPEGEFRTGLEPR